MNAIALNAVITGTFMMVGHLIRLQSARTAEERAQIMLELEAQAQANQVKLEELRAELKSAADEARAWLAEHPS
jgi:hypothetical protein